MSRLSTQWKQLSAKRLSDEAFRSLRWMVKMFQTSHLSTDDRNFLPTDR